MILKNLQSLRDYLNLIRRTSLNINIVKIVATIFYDKRHHFYLKLLEQLQNSGSNSSIERTHAETLAETMEDLVGG